MLNKIIGKGGKKHKKRKFARGFVKYNLCVTILKNYKPGSKKKSYGRCVFSVTKDFSGGGVCIAHKNMLIEGEYVEINSRHNLSKLDCLDCDYLKLVDEKFCTKGIIGKVVWRNSRFCGIEFIDVLPSDQSILKKEAEKYL